MAPNKKSKPQQPITITFTIDPTIQLNTDGQQFMAVTIVARQGDVGHISQFNMTNRNIDLPAQVDKIMRKLLSGAPLPDFPTGTTSPSTTANAASPDPDEDDPIEAVEQTDSTEAETIVSEPAPLDQQEEQPLDTDSGEYDIEIYPAADDTTAATAEPTDGQPLLF